LSTRLKEKEESILQVLENLIKESASGKLIVVEGKKDVAALRTLGIGGNVFTVKTGGKSYLDAIYEIEKMDVPEVILLLDFDRRGKEGTRHLKKGLETVRIKTNIKFWRELSNLVRKEIQCIESLTTYMTALRLKTGSASHKYNSCKKMR
jgi:5S rRNA maturation endonuclease (ribonuclease M5)